MDAIFLGFFVFVVKLLGKYQHYFLFFSVFQLLFSTFQIQAKQVNEMTFGPVV